MWDIVTTKSIDGQVVWTTRKPEIVNFAQNVETLPPYICTI